MSKKYELTDKTKTVRGRTLHRIRALRDFGAVKAGDLGGADCIEPIQVWNDKLGFRGCDSKLT